MPQENAPPRVELWSGRIPIVGWFARHYWLVVVEGDRSDRWEVWQTRGIGPTSWGYLHKNLMPPEAWIKDQHHEKIIEWYDDEARRVRERIAASPESYPWREQYRYWPGPNSNTYVQWILNGIYTLAVNAPGRRYARR